MNLSDSITAHQGSLLPTLPSETDCKNLFKDFRTKEGITCKKCQEKNHYFLQPKWQWQCKKCKFRTTLKSGTAMENSKLSFQHWFRAIMYLSDSEIGVSAKELQRSLGMKRYQPAWAMLHKIRRSNLPRLSDRKFHQEGANPKEFKRPNTVKHGKVGLIYRKKMTHYFNLTIKKEPIAPSTFSKRMMPREILGSHGTFRSVKSSPHKRISLFWFVMKKVHHTISDKYLQNYLDSFAFSLQNGKNLEKRMHRILERMVNY